MMSFEKMHELENDEAIYLAALAQTAVHGWHGMERGEDCAALSIANVIGVDPDYMYDWYITNAYDIPPHVIAAIKVTAANGGLRQFKIIPSELCYPAKWVINEFKGFVKNNPGTTYISSARG